MSSADIVDAVIARRGVCDAPISGEHGGGVFRISRSGALYAVSVIRGGRELFRHCAPRLDAALRIARADIDRALWGDA
jgi:hypothetical protein